MEMTRIFFLGVVLTSAILTQKGYAYPWPQDKSAAELTEGPAVKVVVDGEEKDLFERKGDSVDVHV